MELRGSILDVPDLGARSSSVPPHKSLPRVAPVDGLDRRVGGKAFELLVVLYGFILFYNVLYLSVEFC